MTKLNDLKCNVHIHDTSLNVANEEYPE